MTKKIKLSGYNEKHIVDYYADLLNLIGLDLKHKNLELYLNQDASRKIEEALNKEGVKPEELLVGLIPGAGRSWGKDAYLKHWSPEKFSQLGDKIVENYKAKIIIMGDFCEQEIALKVKKAMHYQATDFSGRTDLSELAALISKMRLIVTNDGGPLHMANALGIKTISVFGPVDDLIYGPYPVSQDNIVIKTDLSCRPCYQNFRLSDCKRGRECLASISVEEVFRAVRRLL